VREKNSTGGGAYTWKRAWGFEKAQEGKEEERTRGKFNGRGAKNARPSCTAGRNSSKSGVHSRSRGGRLKASFQKRENQSKEINFHLENSSPKWKKKDNERTGSFGKRENPANPKDKDPQFWKGGGKKGTPKKKKTCPAVQEGERKGYRRVDEGLGGSLWGKKKENGTRECRKKKKK